LPVEIAEDVQRAVRFLQTANREQGREFALAEQAIRGISPYEFAEHKRLQTILFARATEPIGWNARDLFRDRQLEPFQVWRTIRFLEFKVRLRDRILCDLNKAIELAGVQVGFRAALAFRGLPTLETIQDLKDDFRSGRVGFGHLLETSSQY
jgi:hypothetical protein